jgi:hypothetical protein
MRDLERSGIGGVHLEGLKRSRPKQAANLLHRHLSLIRTNAVKRQPRADKSPAGALVPRSHYTGRKLARGRVSEEEGNCFSSFWDTLRFVFHRPKNTEASSALPARLGATPRSRQQEAVITPDISLVHVREFCRGISAAEVCYVSVQPRLGFECGNCFNNVDSVVSESGGSAVYGWHITEWPGVFIEAEQHSVWRQSDGSLLDPSPHSHGFSRAAFLPDSALGEREFRDNVNQPLI